MGLNIRPFRSEVMLINVPSFSPFSRAIDRRQDLDWGQILITPMQIGAWALIEPMGLQNHAPQLCWIRDDLLALVWMAGDQEGTSGMSVFMSLLSADEGHWGKPQRVSQDPSRSEQNPLLFLSGGCLHLIHSAQKVRDPEDSSWMNENTSY